MNTLHHGYWTFFVSRKQKHTPWFIFGSILPDIVYYVMFLYLCISRNAFQVVDDPDPLKSLFSIVHDLFEHPVVSILRQAGHSIFIWMVIFVVVLVWKGRKLTKWSALMYGWLGHVVVDLLTHVEDAVPLFYPVSSYIFRSRVSYWDEDHYAGIFSLINMVLIVLSLVYLIVKKIRKKHSFTKSS
ncbi:zinc dependent phospholipase C family protein [Halobacillus halophilus]|uniref:zinc dependent phospholipase C family protein n=1 Tax=Halobacillus halophilus TaxID=1570 RepID=UPI001CD41193|nr:zinc dependent phospholipase C family protein [Halobacillus halophilus]MCA1011222.1 metal-dependent hydrolase [Halobacillus halophilus]